jgi:GNAT superfamily N-acetyltransferase
VPLTLRRAAAADREAVRGLCERLNPNDYLPLAWDEWLAGPDSELLLAHRGRRLVGCVFAAPVAPGQVFSQGLRVDPDHRRLGVGTLLMNEQHRRLGQRKIEIARGVTGTNNRRARAFFQKIGWTEVGAFCRRRLPHWSPGRAKATVTASLPDRLLVSSEGRAHFRRIFFSAGAAWLEVAAAQGRWHARDGAHVLLDPPSAEFGTWGVVLGGPPAALASLLQTLSPPWNAARGLTVEAAAEPELQTALDGLGFLPPGPEDSYVVVECRV